MLSRLPIPDPEDWAKYPRMSVQVCIARRLRSWAEHCASVSDSDAAHKKSERFTLPKEWLLGLNVLLKACPVTVCFFIAKASPEFSNNIFCASPMPRSRCWTRPIGGYGELHYNNLNSKKEIDLHRFVLFFGHKFSGRIRFHSEVEIEHAFLKDNSGTSTETLHCPTSAIRYALEVPQGGFQQRGIVPGAMVYGLPQ